MAVHRPFGPNCQNRLFPNSVKSCELGFQTFFKLLTKSLLSSIITENFKAAPFP